MPPRRRRRRNGRALPPIVAIVIGLAVAATFYWYRNPDVELSLPWGITDRVAQQPSRERAPESFAATTATRIPEPTARPAESDGSRQLRRLIPPVGNGTREERQARAELEAVAKAADIELKVHAGINAERARNGVDPQLSWDDQLGAVARAHSEDMTGRCPASTIFAGWRQSVLPVRLLGLDALLGSVGPVAGDVKLQDDGVVHDPVNCRGGGHGVGKDALPLREDQV